MPHQPSSTEHALLSLGRLTHPVDPATFKREYWEQSPLVVKRNDTSYYDGLLSLSDVDHILSTSSIRSDLIRVLRDGKEMSLAELRAAGVYSDIGILESLYAEYRQGSTIVLQFLHERCKPLISMCQSLATEFTAAFQVNVYLTPPHAKGLKTHYDTHDVFVLQTEGSKHWRIYEGPVRLPLRGQAYQSGNEPEAAVITHEVHLQKGDLLYIPRGYMHDAASGDGTSLHLTVGVLPITWAVVLLRAVEGVIERDPRFRESLPPGFATNEDLHESTKARLSELMDVLREKIDPSAIIRDATLGTLSAKQPSLDGHLLDLQAESHVTLGTRVRRRSEPLFRLGVEGENVCLYFHGKVVRFPAYVEPLLRFVVEADEFRGVDLPEGLDDAGKLLLVRKLLHEGFLTISWGSDQQKDREPRKAAAHARPR